MTPTSVAARGVGLRPLRAGVFAAVCVVTTALGHALMSGDLLPWWALGAAFTGTGTAAWWLTARERGALTVVGATTAVQALLHLWFDLAHMVVRMPSNASGMSGRAAVSGMDHAMAFSGSGMVMHMGGHADMAMAPMGTAGAASALSARSALTHHGSIGMFLAHLLAAVVCGLWLWRGETAVHRLARALAVTLLAPLRRVRRMLAGPVPARRSGVARPVAATVQAPPVAFAVLRHAVIRRGPPRAGSAVLRPTGPLSAVRL